MGTMKCDWDERARHRLWSNASGDEKSMVLRMTKGAEEMRRGSIWIEKDRGVEERKGKERK